MGYTHYWRMSTDLDLGAYRRGLLNAARIVQASPIPLGDLAGGGDGPEINERMISFNGLGEDAHETCQLLMDPHGDEHAYYAADGRLFEFTKTARKPYDVVVTAVLAAIAHERPRGFTVYSDGGRDEWADGLALARRILDDDTIGYPVMEEVEA